MTLKHFFDIIVIVLKYLNTGKQGDLMLRKQWEQLTLLSVFQTLKPGEYVTTHGKDLKFHELHQKIGQLVILDQSTQSQRVWRVVRVEAIIPHEGAERFIYYYGSKQCGLINQRYFERQENPIKVWAVAA